MARTKSMANVVAGMRARRSGGAAPPIDMNNPVVNPIPRAAAVPLFPLAAAAAAVPLVPLAAAAAAVVCPAASACTAGVAPPAWGAWRRRQSRRRQPRCRTCASRLSAAAQRQVAAGR